MDTKRAKEAFAIAKKVVFDDIKIQQAKNNSCIGSEHDGEVLIAIATLAGAILVANKET